MQLTGILVEDDKTKKVLAYVHQFPGVMAEGDSIADAKNKLEKAWENFLKVMEKNHPFQYQQPNTPLA